MEIWDPKPPGTLWATPDMLRDCFTLFTYTLSVLVYVWDLCEVSVLSVARSLVCLIK